MLSHIPFRSWCPHCVAGRARYSGHYRVRDPRTTPSSTSSSIGAYCLDQGNNSVQVMRDASCGYNIARAMGLARYHGAEVMADDTTLLGHARVVLKSGLEPALRSLQEEVQRRRTKPAIVVNAGVGQPQSIWIAERAARPIPGQERVMRHWLHSHLDMDTPP